MYIFIQNFTFSSTCLAYLVAAYLFFFRPDKYWWFITVVLKTAKKISKAFNNKIKELNKQIQYSSNKHMSTDKI